jgi:cytochrome c-type biogenesis protein CcmE
MKAKHKRATFVFVGLALLAGAAVLVLTALESSVTYFYTPGQAGLEKVQPGQRIRLGGFVAKDSVTKLADGVTIRFSITDKTQSVTVLFKGVLPDLFREGQGVVTEGAFRPDRIFVAATVLAKHDENYIPKELADQLKKQGVWHKRGKDYTAPKK